MYVTVNIKNMKHVQDRVKSVKTAIPVVNEQTAKKLSRILKKKAIRYLEMSAPHSDTVSTRMRNKLIVGKAFQKGNKWFASLVARKEAIFFERGVSPHKVLLDPNEAKKPSWVGTPRSKFEERLMSYSGGKRSITVRTPATHFMSNTFKYANRNALNLYARAIDKRFKEVFA